MEIKTQLNHLHMAPRKVRLVADMIRGRDVTRAEMMLVNMPKRASMPLLKLLRSALADARHNFQVSASDFYVKEIRVDPGPVAKRTRARAFGRAASIRRRTSHVILFLDTRGRGDGALVARKKGAPVVRDITPEDKPRAGVKPARGERASSLNVQKPKPSGAIRRIFQRKVI